MAQYLLKEDGSKITQESSDGLLIWSEFYFLTYYLKKEDGFYILQQDGTSKVISSQTPILTPLVTKSLQYSLVGQLHAYKEIRTSLYTDLTPLSTEYTSTEYTNAASDNAVRVTLGAIAEGNYGIHQFVLGAANATQGINITINLQTAVPPASQTVFLQIYNFFTSAWETVDSESAAAASTDFDLTASIVASVGHYYSSPGNVVYVRVYQFFG